MFDPNYGVPCFVKPRKFELDSLWLVRVVGMFCLAVVDVGWKILLDLKRSDENSLEFAKEFWRMVEIKREMRREPRKS